ncbi:MAG: hypothetical protein ACPGQJ_10985 [Acidimicrobiales bacterium]
MSAYVLTTHEATSRLCELIGAAQVLVSPVTTRELRAHRVDILDAVS